MADTSIGTARIDVEVNAETAEATVKRLARGVEDFSKQAQQQYNQLSAAEKRRAQSLIKQADTLGLTRAEQIAYNAQLKLSGPLLDEFNRKLALSEARARTAGAGLGNTGKSAKELQFAMRGLPAQLTDIFTSLASGQRPTMVLLQQGGQLKDMFGGIGPAASALGSALMRLINPITLVAAASGALFLAWKQGSDEAVAFNKALILTGNYAGVTAKEAQRLAEEMDNLAGVTQGKAAAALAQVATTGRFTGEAFTQVTEAALAMQVATGKAIDDTIAEFDKIRKDPVKALLELNSTYHFLTKAQLAHIVQLQDEGREAEAAAEATRLYSDVLQDRAQQINASLGVLQSQWRGLKNIAAEAWDSLLAVGREDTIANRIAQAAVLASQSNFGGAFAHLNGSVRDADASRLVEAALAENDQLLQGVDSERAAKEIEEQRKAKEEATRTWLQLSQQNLDKKQKQLAEEKKITEAGRALGKSEAQINEEIAKSRARFAESQKKSGGSKASTTDPTASILSRIRQQITLNQQAAEGEGKVTAAQRLRVQVEEELARIGAKATPARRAEIEAGLKQVEVSEAAAEAAKVEARAKEELTRLTNQLAAAEQNRRAQNELDLLSIGRGGEELERAQRRLDIEREYEDGLKQLRDRGVAEDSDSYRQQEQALRESRDRMLAEEEDYFARRTEMMADWRNGAAAAVDDYLAFVADVAGRTRDYLNGVFDSFSEGFADFITGSKSAKDAFGDFADYLFQQSARMVADQLLGSLLKGLTGAGASGGTNSGEAAGSLLDLFTSDGFGFASGGYTGDGPRNQPAGLVHKGEFVVNAASTRALGRGVLDQLNLGRMPAMGGGSVSISMVNNFDRNNSGSTPEQIAFRTGRAAQRAIARNS